MLQQLMFGEGISIGTFVEGGYFAGYISQTANGVATHGLIVAPAASGYNGQNTIQLKTSTTSTSGTSSVFDGAANTANMANTSHPAANYCAGLVINGYNDWYLPALYELEIAYYNLKPTTNSNTVYEGTNAYSVPARGSNYTTGDPAQTSVAAFQSGGAEAFLSAYHWSSSEVWLGLTAYQGSVLSFYDGLQATSSKTSALYARAFRKFAV